MAPVYVLDSNAFIQPKRSGYYTKELCPGYWKALLAIHKKDGAFSLDKVFTELNGQGDEVEAWAKAAPATFFVSSADTSIVKNFGDLMTWVNSHSLYLPAAKSEFAGIADGWLVAYAMANKCQLVTFEKPNPDQKRKVPIPSLCDNFGVKYCTPFEMLKAYKIKFDWNP